jgi:hypothetical protein
LESESGVISSVVQQANPAFEGRWRSRHDKPYHDTLPAAVENQGNGGPFDDRFDPVEAGLQDRAREFLQAMLEAELDEVLGRSRYVRGANNASRRMEEHAHRKARWDAGLPYWTDEGLENL